VDENLNKIYFQRTVGISLVCHIQLFENKLLYDNFIFELKQNDNNFEDCEMCIQQFGTETINNNNIIL